MSEQLFTTHSLANLLRVSPRTILRERLAGRLSYKKIRGRIRFTEEDIDVYLQRQTRLSFAGNGQEFSLTEKVRVFSRRR